MGETLGSWISKCFMVKMDLEMYGKLLIFSVRTTRRGRMRNVWMRDGTKVVQRVKNGRQEKCLTITQKYKRVQGRPQMRWVDVVSMWAYANECCWMQRWVEAYSTVNGERLKMIIIICLNGWKFICLYLLLRKSRPKKNGMRLRKVADINHSAITGSHKAICAIYGIVTN